MNARAPRGGAALVVALGALVSGCRPAAEPSVLDAGVAPDVPRYVRPDAPRFDAPHARDAPFDGDAPDAYDPRDCVTLEPGTFGSACRSDSTCEAGLTCGIGAATLVVPLGGASPVPLALGEGFCTTRCDPRAARPCACGTCVTSWAVGTGRVSIVDELGRGVCVQPCFPDVPGSRLECRGAFGCDTTSRGCVPACTSDDACLFTSIPGSGSGGGARFVALADEPPLPITCALARGECLRRDPAGAPQLGEPCTSDVECPLGHICWAPALGAPATCARLAECAEAGCGTDRVCVAVDGIVEACAALGP